MDYSADTSMQVFLAATKFRCDILTRRTGGHANNTWRGHLHTPLPNGARTIIIKHTQTMNFSFSNDGPGFTLSSNRMDYEHMMLVALHEHLLSHGENPSTTVPEVYAYFHEEKILVMEDAGKGQSKDLKATLIADHLTSSQATLIGKQLGVFLTEFHAWGKSATELGERLEKHSQASDITLYAYYTRLPETCRMVSWGKSLEEYLPDFARAEEVMTREMKLRGNIGITHGDFWTGNVLVSVNSVGDDALRDVDNSLPTLHIVDWEVAKIAPPAFDVGQMAAELFLVNHFKGSAKALLSLDAFLTYNTSLKSDDSRLKAAIHFGAHLLVWPVLIPGWGTMEHIEECTKIGALSIRHALNGDISWFKQSALKALWNSAG